ncbi:MAG: hypothetical protein R3F60_10910 [bacterium]
MAFALLQTSAALQEAEVEAGRPLAGRGIRGAGPGGGAVVARLFAVNLAQAWWSCCDASGRGHPEAVHVRGAGAAGRSPLRGSLAGVSVAADRVRFASTGARGGVPGSAPGRRIRSSLRRWAKVLATPPVATDLAGLRAQLEARCRAPGFAAAPVVEGLLRSAAALGASDLHIQPTLEGGHGLSVRIDGVLHGLGALAPACAQRLLGRLKILAGVQVHRDDVPQEGRASCLGSDGSCGWLGFAPGWAARP